MAEDLPPAKRQKLTDEENPSDAASIPHLLEQLPKYVQEANEEELIHLKERHGVAQTQEERPPAPTASSDASANPQPTTTNKPFLKRKMAMVIGYLGYKYQGLQRNPGAITIEALLEAALCKVGAIAAVNAHQWDSGLDWMRAARTDKGVSAAINVISLNMLIVPEFVERMNAVLPEDIRVFGVYPVPRSFSAKDRCSARIYEYRVPTAIFRPSSQNTRFSAADWTFTPEFRAYVNEILSAYLGTHRFHNFTIKMSYKEPQTERYITSFVCSEPYTLGEMEFVTLTVRGQSFVLHQIRKMVAVAISVVRDGQTGDVIKALFTPQKQDNITMAPSEGLCLASLDFDRYNAKILTDKDANAEPITLDNERSKISAFRDDVIVPHLAVLEAEKHIFRTWLEGWQRFPLNYSKILSVLHKPMNKAL